MSNIWYISMRLFGLDDLLISLVVNGMAAAIKNLRDLSLVIIYAFLGARICLSFLPYFRQYCILCYCWYFVLLATDVLLGNGFHKDEFATHCLLIPGTTSSYGRKNLSYNFSKNWIIFYLLCRYARYGDVSPKVDVYAFGVVLYELISAKEAVLKAYDSTSESKSLVALVIFFPSL